MEGTWFVPDQEPDDNEKKAEKKDKKDVAAVMQRASLLELFSGQKDETEKPVEKEEADVAKHEQSPDETAEQTETLDATTEAVLSDDEQMALGEALVDERLEAVEAELEDTSLSPEAQAAALAAAEYLEQVAKRLDEGEPLTDEALVEAADAVANASEATEPEAELPDTDDEVVPAMTPPTPPPTAPTAGGGSNGGGSLPPTPTFPLPMPGPAVPFGGGPASTPNFNTLPTTPAHTSEASERHSHARYVLVGGIVGYLIGRRRGRIKTEKQLLPVQQKLEKTVDDLRGQLLNQEQKVRSLAAERRDMGTQLSVVEARQHIAQQREKRSEHLRQLAEKEPPAPEQLGKFALRLQERPELPKAREMGDQQLFELAQKIPIRGSSVAELYRQGRLDIATVREIADAFLAGKSYEQLTIKAMQTDSYQGAGGAASGPVASTDPMTKLADLLPTHVANRMNNDYWPPEKKEAHIMARVGLVAAFSTLVVVVAIIVTLWMLRAL